MKNKIVPKITLLILLIGFVVLAFKIRIEPVKSTWTGTVYIRADGSIDPPDAPIITYDNITYTLTDNIMSSGDGIVVERDNIIIDGADYTIQGTGEYPNKGISLNGRINVTVMNAQILNFVQGVYLWNSSNNSICRNNINGCGIYLEYSSNYNSIQENNIINGFISFVNSNYNTLTRNIIIGNGWIGISFTQSSNNIVSQNKITKHNCGIYLYTCSELNTFFENSITDNNYGIGFSVYGPSSNNKFYHNNFINNNVHVSEINNLPLIHAGNNTWDNGYPSGGNYWSDYTGVDLYSGPYQNETGSDGIGDTPYNADRYPLMAPFAAFDAGVWNGTTYYIDIVSNSTVSNFQMNAIEKTVSFNVSGADGTLGFCRLTLPYVIVQELWNGNFSVLFDGRRTELRKWENSEIYIYLNYRHSEHKITLLQTSNRTLQIITTTGGITNPPPANYTYIVGEQVNVTAIPYKGYLFDHWLLDGNMRTENPISIVMDSNHTLYAVFTEAFNLTITCTLGGTTDPLPGIYTYVNGTEVPVTAIPDMGFSFSYWLLDGDVRIENPITVTMDRNHTLEAYFVDDISPTTTDDYDGLWHNSDFMITLTAVDYGSGVAETYYRIDNGSVRRVSIDGYPLITSESANNTLEYWSVDNAGNEEIPHKILFEIKLDKTSPLVTGHSRFPEDNVEPGQPVRITVNVTDNLSGVKDVILTYRVSSESVWHNVTMTLNQTTMLYEATIQMQQPNVNVEYKIIAYDNAENSIVEDNNGLYYKYYVIPEFPSAIVTLLAVLIASTAIVLLKRRKEPKPQCIRYHF